MYLNTSAYVFDTSKSASEVLILIDFQEGGVRLCEQGGGASGMRSGGTGARAAVKAARDSA